MAPVTSSPPPTAPITPPSGASIRGARSASLDLSLVRDTYVPQWNVTVRHLPLDCTARIRVTLRDKDMINDDPIGVAEINAAQVRLALAARDVYQVPVRDQTNDQILFIGISAIAE